MRTEKSARTDKKAVKYGSAADSPGKSADEIKGKQDLNTGFYAPKTEPAGVVAEVAMLEEQTDQMDPMWMAPVAVEHARPSFGATAADENRLARRLIAEVSRDNADVNSLCGAYKLKREELGRLTGFSLRALAEWAGGKLPSQPAKRRLHEVRRLLDGLAEIVKVESIPQWLHQPNPGFERLTPLQVIEVGEIDRLWAMVHDLGSGQPA